MKTVARVGRHRCEFCERVRAMVFDVPCGEIVCVTCLLGHKSKCATCIVTERDDTESKHEKKPKRFIGHDSGRAQGTAF